MDNKKYVSFQFKVPHELWNKFKIKSITENSDTYKDTLIQLIKEYVRT